MTFTRLFEPINIGKMAVRNRIAMAAMGTGFATKDGLVTEQLKDYYEARARGGAGMVIVENASTDFYGAQQVSNRVRVDNDFTLPGLTGLAGVIKKHGARAIIQLNHSGRMAQFKLGGFPPVAPSPIPYPGGSSHLGESPKELTVEEIQGVVGLFASAAARSKKAGFEGVEIHAAHGYLLATFLSPLSNQRQDAYGGDVEKRARILVEVLKAIRKSVGRDFPVWCRVNGREFGIENGLTLSDSIAIARMTSDLVDAVHVTCFGYNRDSVVNIPDVPGALLPLAQAIRQSVCR